MGMMGAKGSRGLVSDINVTPLVDVMLVLLIIFMVTAPMMMQSGDIDLPETSAQPLRQEDEPFTISFSKDGLIKLKDDTEIAQVALVHELENKFPEEEDRKNQIIYLSADKEAPYEKVYSLLQDLLKAGFAKVGMVTKHIDDAADKRK